MHALHPHDYDWIRMSVDAALPDVGAAALDGLTDSFRHGVLVRRQGSLSPDIRVMAYPGHTTVVGSPHKHVLGESVGRFGPAEIRAFLYDVADRLGFAPDLVLSSRLSRFDLSLNLYVDHDVAEILRLVSPPPQMTEVGSGPRSRAYTNTVRALILYDKVQKLLDTGKGHLVPQGWEPGRVLRLEARFKRLRTEFGRAVTAGDLCDPDFYAEAKQRWLRLVLSAPVRDGDLLVPRGHTVPDLRDSYAAIGIVTTGGQAAAIERINAERWRGQIGPGPATRQRTWVKSVNVMFEDDMAIIEPSIAEEFRSALFDSVRA